MSACLLGEAVRYDGGDCVRHLDAQAKRRIQAWQAAGWLLPFCPEVAGGLPVPRAAAEIQGDKVKTAAGEDVTAAFRRGAALALQQCQRYGITLAVLKQGSPSCGHALINDGTFTKRKIVGQGVTAQWLTQHGVTVLDEQQLACVDEHGFVSLEILAGLAL